MRRVQHQKKMSLRPNRQRKFCLADIAHLWDEDRDDLPDWLVGANRK